MTDEPPLLPSLEGTYSAAIHDVNRWRGHCIELFARIDEAVAGALETMATKNPTANVRTPHLFGQRITALSAALQPDQPFAARAGQIHKTLAKLEPFLAQRNILVHATGSIWVDAKERWLWRYCVTPSGRNRVQEKGTIDRDEASAMEKELRASVPKLLRPASPLQGDARVAGDAAKPRREPCPLCGRSAGKTSFSPRWLSIALLAFTCSLWRGKGRQSCMPAIIVTAIAALASATPAVACSVVDNYRVPTNLGLATSSEVVMLAQD